MNLQQGILVELFALVLVAFGGFYWLVEPGNSVLLVVNLRIVVGATLNPSTSMGSKKIGVTVYFLLLGLGLCRCKHTSDIGLLPESPSPKANRN